MTTVQVTNLEKVPFLAFPADIEEGIQEVKTEFYAKDKVKSLPFFDHFMTISSHCFDNYLNMFHKSEVQTSVL